MNVNRYASLFSLSVMLLVSGLAYGGSPKESGEPWAKYINDDRYRPVPLRDRADSVSYAAGLLVAMYKLEPLVWHYDLEKLARGFSFSVLKQGCRAAAAVLSVGGYFQPDRDAQKRHPVGHHPIRGRVSSGNVLC